MTATTANVNVAIAAKGTSPSNGLSFTFTPGTGLPAGVLSSDGSLDFADLHLGLKELAAEDRDGWVPLAHSDRLRDVVGIHERAEVELVRTVAEWDRHSNEYVPIEELKANDDPRWQALVRGEWTAHDETPEQFAARTVGALERIVAAHRGERVVVVCHGGVINGYLAHVLGLREYSFFYPNYTSIHRVAAAGTGERSIVTVNETPHLRGTGLPIGLFQR